MTVRPEFDVTLAYNPDSVLMPVARVEGIGLTLLGAGTGAAARSSPARAAWCGWTAAPTRSARARCSSTWAATRRA